MDNIGTGILVVGDNMKNDLKVPCPAFRLSLTFFLRSTSGIYLGLGAKTWPFLNLSIPIAIKQAAFLTVPLRLMCMVMLWSGLKHLLITSV